MENAAEETEVRSTRSRRSKAAPKPPVTPAKKTRASRAKKQVEETSESEEIEAIIEQSAEEVVTMVEDQQTVDRKTPESIQVLEQLQDLITPAYEEAEVVEQGQEFSEQFETLPDGDVIEDAADDVAQEVVEHIPDDEAQRNTSTDAIEGIMFYDAVAGDQENVESMEVDQSTTASSGNAIAEDLENGLNKNDDTNKGLDADMVSEEELPMTRNVENAEVVSDEELPAVPKAAVKDAEEVSDDELPGPKMAELPADTEVVSEEELPASTKKRKAEDGYDPNSPTEAAGADVPEKKLKTAEDEKAVEKEKAPEKPKTLPELDKYWKAVNDDVSDFTAWTYLLQYVDQENDIDAAREAYDAFLAHYPYCYGYWRKYADYEKRKGNKKKCEEVFERGIKAIPLSVDLWIHYLTHVKANYTDNEEHIRAQFERALAACGLEFRSDKLYEAYIKWENESKNISNIISIYDRLLATPTQGYNKHYDDLQDVVNANPVNKLVKVDVFCKLRAEVRTDSKDQSDTGTDDYPPGEDEPDDHVRNEDEAQKIVDKIMSSKKKVHKANIQAVTARWTYEEGIKRPYFHVKPLERCQLKNWKEYLDYEIEQGDQKRILVLFERCLIACALYDDFWLKLIRYLEDQHLVNESPELIGRIRDAYERACTIHHLDKPTLHIMWAAFEEVQNNYTKSAEILTNLDKTCPNLLQVAYRRINLERRRGDFEKCGQLYEHYIAQAKNKNVAGSLAIKYARFLHKVQGNLDAGYAILQGVLEKDPTNTRVALQMIDLALQRGTVDENEVLAIMELFMSRDSIEPDQKVLFAQRRVEFLEDFGSTAKMLQDAQRSLQVALTKANEAKKKAASDAKKAAKESQPPLPPSTNSSTSYSSAGYAYAPSSSAYYGNSASGGSYQSYGSSDGYGQYGQWTGQYPQSNYGNYSQWSSYGGSYY